MKVVQQVCAELAGAIEDRAGDAELDRLVAAGVGALLEKCGGGPPHRAILGCTHFPLVEDVFRRHLPQATRLLSQPELVADSLDHYLERHPGYVDPAAEGSVMLLTSGDPQRVDATARVFWPQAPAFRSASAV